MKEHPIPQDITNYRFHIVGSMTLKQFGEVAIGVALAFFIYQTNLINIIKWPLIFLAFGGGLAAGFVPIEERPLSHWITTFLTILYKPTQFFWKRMYNIPPAFLFKGNAEHMLQFKELDLSPARRQRIKEFLSSTKEQVDSDPFSVEEKYKIDGIMNIFNTQQVFIETTSQPQVEMVEKPNLVLRPRSLRENQELATLDASVLVPEDRATINSLDAGADLSSTVVFQAQEPQKSSLKKNSFLAPEQVAQTLEIPESPAIAVEEKIKEEDVSALLQQQQVNNKERAFVEQAGDISKPVSASEKAQFNAQLPFPTKPTVPNKIVGMVLSPANEIIAGAIVEIKTPNGHVTRAVKTNALGQFFITTPLESGTYIVEVDKEGFSFQAVQIDLQGQIVDPIEIRSV